MLQIRSFLTTEGEDENRSRCSAILTKPLPTQHHLKFGRRDISTHEHLTVSSSTAGHSTFSSVCVYLQLCSP